MTAIRKKRITVLRVFLLALSLLVFSSACFLAWFSMNYKQVLRKRIPASVLKSSDSIYHLSFTDLKVSLPQHSIIINNVTLWADTNQVNALRQRACYSPNTVSNVFMPLVEIKGITWWHIISGKSFDCKSIIVHHPNWFLQTIKHHPDLSMIPTKDHSSMIERFASENFQVLNPDFTYHYVGDKYNYYFYLKGGTAILNDWAVDKDIAKDTSTILYARHGSIVPDSIMFRKDGQIYHSGSPVADFMTADKSVTLKNVKIRDMTVVDAKTGKVMEVYNFSFPEISLTNFNWKRLLNEDYLKATDIYATEPFVGIHVIRDAAPTPKNRMGAFPNQLIREAIKTNISALHLKNGKIKYTEPVKNQAAPFVIQFDDVKGDFDHIVNIDSVIDRHKECTIKLEGKYMNKSLVSATFHMSLTDPKGHFVVDGFVNNLNGDDVSSQAAAFTFAKVTSFNMSHMTGHIVGDESYSEGRFTMLYQDLKISLFKFKNDNRKSKKGPFSFLADATILYPSNPMPGKDARSVGAFLTRDPNHGFIYLIWKNMYLGAQKTAVRDEQIIKLAGGQTDTKEDPPKKVGFFKKIFGKLKRKKSR